MKLWKLGKKEQALQTQNETPILNGNNQLQTLEMPKETKTSDVPETYKEHYPLLLPFSYAAIVEDEKNELKYSLLEPTLTELDKQLLDELKNILWDELSINIKSLKDPQCSRRILKI